MDAKQLGSLILSIAIVAVALNGFFGIATDTQPPLEVDEDVLISGGSGELSYDGQIENFQIGQSLGDSVELTGASDSELEGSATLQRDTTWSVSLWAEADQNRTQRAVQLGDWLMVDLVNDSATPEWRVTYYDESDWEVHQVNVSAGNATTWTNLVITANESEMVVYRNATRAGAVNLSTGGASVPQNVSNWDGRLEETRLLDDVVNSSQRQTLYAEPTAPVRANETARIYYDAWDGEQAVDVYRTGSDLQLSNASFAPGFDGQELSSGGLLSNGDYQRDGDTIVVVDGGKLDGAPVVFVSYEGTGGQVLNLHQVANVVESGMSLLALGAVVGAAVILLRLWDDF